MYHRLNGFLLLLVIMAGCSTPAQRVVTYHQDIAPIMIRSCAPCHRPGSAGPFNLLTYEDAVRHASTMLLTVSTGFMPPWPADTTYVHFKDEKVLSAQEISLIRSWVESGKPEGEPVDAPATPAPRMTEYGAPDFSVTLARPFPLPGDNTDRFMMMKVPVELPADTFIRFIEIIPGNKKLVHHINGHLVLYEPEKKKDLHKGSYAADAEKQEKAVAYRLLDLANDDGTYPMLSPSVTNYLPGVEPAVYPEGIGGYRLSRKSHLLLDNIHYGPTPVDTSDLTTFNFYFMPHAPVRPVQEFILGTSGISPVEPPLVIPPGAVRSFTTRYVLPEDISLLTVNPHMHLLGSVFKAYALTPEGDTVRLIRIPKWDFRWQYFYTYPRPVHLTAGTTIIVEGTFDNTENNPLNPFHPPRTVAEREGSMRTTDEMFQFICTYLPYRPGDENIPLDNTVSK